jgi:hypothetical protein
MAYSDADDFLNGEGDFGPQAPSAKWGKTGRNDRCKPGTVEKGVITDEPFMLQQREYKADGSIGEPKFWNKPGTKEPDPDKPMMQMKVIIQTDHREFDDDDGRRAVFVKGALRTAVVAAIKEAKAPGLRIGGWLAIKCTGMVPAASGYDTYTWEVKYAPPPPAADGFTADAGDSMEPPATLVPPPPAIAASATRSTLDAIRNSGHQASLRQGFDDEPPF